MSKPTGPGSPAPSAPSAGPRLIPLLLIAALVGLVAHPALAQRPQVYAVTGATVIVSPGEVLEGATVVIRDGLIEAVGQEVTPPADAEIVDGEGLWLHAGFIDAYSHVGLPQQQGGGGGGFDFSALLQGGGEPDPGTGHPIDLVHPQHHVTSELVPGDASIERHREIGFTAALTAPRDGIFRGWSALLALRDGAPRELVIDPEVAQHMGFDTGNFFGGYPSAEFGAMATIRQVHHDAFRYVEWQRRWEANPSGLRRPEYNDAFAALAPMVEHDVPVVAHAGSNRRIERALRVALESGVRPILVGSGREYDMLGFLAEHADAIRGLIVPLDLPDEPDVSGENRLPYVSLDSLHHWEQAAGNAAKIAESGIPFALTPYGAGSLGKFHDNLRAAIDAGLSTDDALAALTTTPAAMLGVSDALGTVETGKIANLVAVDGEPFGEETEIRHIWVDGHWYEMEAAEEVGDPDAVVDPRGEWAVTGTVMGQSQESTWTIEGSPGSYSGTSVGQMGSADFSSVTLEGNALTVSLPVPGMGSLEVTVVIEGDEFTGDTSIDLPNGQSMTINFRGERTSGPEGGAR